jgi:hypothetical protein
VTSNPWNLKCVLLFSKFYFHINLNSLYVQAWMLKPGNEKFARGVSVPSSLMGRDIVRMSPR